MSTAIATLLLLLLALPTAALASKTTATAFDLLADGSIVVPVTIAGTGPYRFVLDTGSSRTVIATALSKRLRLPVVAKTLLVTPAGRDVAHIVRLQDVAVLGRPTVDVSAAVMPADRYAAGQRVDGLIGQDLLATLIYTIDYDQREVVWHEPDDTLPGERLPLTNRHNRLLVTLAQRDGDPRPLSLVPDSGSDALVLFAHAQDKLQLTPLDEGMLTSMSGSRMVRRVQVVGRVMVGSARLQSPLAVVIDSGETAEMMGDGLLPLNLFARVTFNVAAGYLTVHAR